jgi:hypothetical protein
MADAFASDSADEVAPPATIRESGGAARLVPLIAGLMLGMLLAALDQTVVSTALPQVIGHLADKQPKICPLGIRPMGD